MSVQDEIYRVTGLGVNDGQAAHFGKTPTESLQDAELRFVNSLLITEQEQINDAWKQLGKESGAFSAAVPGIKLEYWQNVP